MTNNTNQIMNEQIKELLEQVGGHGTQALMHPDDIEKFSKLIINSCIEIVMSDKVISWADSIRIKNNIKENFGVE